MKWDYLLQNQLFPSAMKNSGLVEFSHVNMNPFKTCILQSLMISLHRPQSVDMRHELTLCNVWSDLFCWEKNESWIYFAVMVATVATTSIIYAPRVWRNVSLSVEWIARLRLLGEVAVDGWALQEHNKDSSDVTCVTRTVWSLSVYLTIDKIILLGLLAIIFSKSKFK